MTFTDSTAAVDTVFHFIVVISLVLLVSITLTMIYFVMKYNRRKKTIPKNIESNLLLEVTWIAVPTVLVLAMFYFGWSSYRFMRTVPDNAMTVKTTGKMWSWQFDYENGKRSGELRVPLGRPVRLTITSTDVIHSLFIPAFRVKQDAIPDRETFLWFLPDRKGTYDLFCSEYCGVKHSSMASRVIVMAPEDFDSWYAVTEDTEKEKKEASVPRGAGLLEEKGCLDCHATDGSTIVGPALNGLYGRTALVITGGRERTVVADEAYIIRSVREPGSDIVKGFPDIMPPQGDEVTEEELGSIVSYLKGLK